MPPPQAASGCAQCAGGAHGPCAHGAGAPPHTCTRAEKFCGNPFRKLLRPLPTADGASLLFYDLSTLEDARVARLPRCIRVLLESLVRNCDGRFVTESDVARLLDWEALQGTGDLSVPFVPARVLYQDLSGLPALTDFAAMRDAVTRLGGDPLRVRLRCPVDVVLEQPAETEATGNPALEANQQLEFERHRERFAFLKWSAQAFDGVSVLPPGAGIVRQMNFEYAARFVVESDGVVCPDSVLGSDSHVAMIGALGVLGLSAGGMEPECALLGQPMAFSLTRVVGCKLAGVLPPYATSTDVVLAVTKTLREADVAGCVVEFLGAGIRHLSISDRATIVNMCPEYGAVAGFFPADEAALAHIQHKSGMRDRIGTLRSLLSAMGLLRTDDDGDASTIAYSRVVEIDLSAVAPACSGPKRPQDKVPLANMKADFLACLAAKLGPRGFDIHAPRLADKVAFVHEGRTHTIGHGAVVIAAITSCTNATNPSVMLAAGLMAKKVADRNLTAAPYVRKSFSPGSRVVAWYLERAGVLPALERIGFPTVGYGCMACAGNSGGQLPEALADAIEKHRLVAVGVLSGNRNFEGRIHPLTPANYLVSPLLVIAYAIAGRIDIDFEAEPLGVDGEGAPVYLRDVWPSREEVHSVERDVIVPSIFREMDARIAGAALPWHTLASPSGPLYPWDPNSTFIKRPPFFDDLTRDVRPLACMRDVPILLMLGDGVSSDHISPAGSILRNSPASKYLASKGLVPRDFSSYGARRAHDAVMARGTFGNPKLTNCALASASGRPGACAAGGSVKALHAHSGEVMDVFDCADRYCRERRGPPLAVLAGADYGVGSAREWAVKGPWVVGVRVVVAHSFDRKHRAGLVAMGILPLQFLADAPDAPTNNTGVVGGTTIRSSDGFVPSVGSRDSGSASLPVHFCEDASCTNYGRAGFGTTSPCAPAQTLSRERAPAKGAVIHRVVAGRTVRLDHVALSRDGARLGCQVERACVAGATECPAAALCDTHSLSSGAPSPPPTHCASKLCASGLTGRELLTIDLSDGVEPGAILTLRTDNGRVFRVRVLLSTTAEVEMVRHGGVLMMEARALLT